MEKKGIGHVEVVLAFVLFMSSLLFILSFVDFRGDSSTGEASLSYVSSRIQNEAQTTVITYSIVVNKTALNQQPQPSSVIVIELPEPISAVQRFRVEKVTRGKAQLVPAKRDPSNPKRIIVEHQDASLLRIVVSEAIDENESPNLTPSSYNQTYYTVSTRAQVLMIAQNKLSELAEGYTRDYSSFREQHDIGKHIDLAFTISWTNADRQDFIKAERIVPSRVDVTAHNLRQELLLRDGQRVFADVIVKVW